MPRAKKEPEQWKYVSSLIVILLSDIFILCAPMERWNMPSASDDREPVAFACVNTKSKSVSKLY